MNEQRLTPAADLRRKLLWLMGLRVAITTVVLGSAVLLQITRPGRLPVGPFFILIGLTYALSPIYAWTLRHIDRHRWLIDLQLVLDALIVSAIVFLSGGVTSDFAPLYVLPILAGSILQYRRGGLTVAVLSALVYGGMVLAQYTGAPGVLEGVDWIGQWPVPPPAQIGRITVGLNVFALLAVAVLSGYLAEGLKRAGVSLEMASSEIAGLQAFNQHVIDSLTSGLATTDVNLRLLTFNRAALAITGCAHATVIGAHVQDVLRPPASFLDSLTACLTEGGSRRVDFEYHTGDDRQIHIGLSAAPLDMPGGQRGLLLTFRDITETKRLERLALMQQRLAAVGEMAASVAHEIRNPLASISGSVQVMQRELSLSDDQAQLMDIILRESQRLDNTIRSLLAYVRPERPAPALLDLQPLLDETARLLANSAEVGPGHSIRVEMPQGDLSLEADEAQVRQIVWNLATNGLRAMPDGGRLTLSAGIDAVGSVSDQGTTARRVVISVQDEGVGMADDQLDRIFQPFHGSFARGSGLGLAIVHRIVHDCRGDIDVASRPGHGTTVRVRLPQRLARAA